MITRFPLATAGLLLTAALAVDLQAQGPTAAPVATPGPVATADAPTYVLLAEPLPPGGIKHLIEAVHALDPDALLAEHGRAVKMRSVRPLGMDQIAGACVATGVIGEGDIIVVTDDPAVLWAAAHPHLHPATGETFPPWAAGTDTTGLAAIKQAWAQEHALTCPFGLSPACIGAP